MLDGVEFEKKGIPSSVICTEVFEDISNSVTELHGLKQYQVQYVPHPISAKSGAQLQEAAEKVYDSVVAWLKKGG